MTAGRIRDSHPLGRPVPRNLDRRRTRSILYKLQLGPREGPDFKFELLPLHSPLLGQSLLVSFPPLIDMLKFSGYPYLIRGQPERMVGGVDWQTRSRGFQSESCATTFTTLEAGPRRHYVPGPSPGDGGPTPSRA